MHSLLYHADFQFTRLLYLGIFALGVAWKGISGSSGHLTTSVLVQANTLCYKK